MKSISNEKKAEILAAYNEYIVSEFNNKPFNNIEYAISDGSLLGIAYTEYEDDDDYDYYAIQVNYDIDMERYITLLYYANNETERIEEHATIEQFIEDLKWCRFEDFILLQEV